MANVKEVIFRCDRYPEYRMVVKPFNGKDDKGVKIKPVPLQFLMNPAIQAGELRVRDEDLIEFVRQDDLYKCGKIVEVTQAELDKDVKDATPPPAKVHAGVLTTKTVRTPSGAPKGKSKPVKGAKVAK